MNRWKATFRVILTHNHYLCSLKKGKRCTRKRIGLIFKLSATVSGSPETLTNRGTLEKARQEVARLYGNRLRLRVCGICVENNKILMLSHRGIGHTDIFWCPPGGGIQFGESTHEALKREFEEETGLMIDIGNLLFVNEFMQPPLHALELFFEVKCTGGHLHLGTDPEMTGDTQIIQEMRWMSFEEIKAYPSHEVHTLFKHCERLSDIYQLRGYLNESSQLAEVDIN